MANNTKVYKIEINGISESISELDALIGKAEELSRKLSQGLTVEVNPQIKQPTNNNQTQAAEKTFEIQAKITAEVEKQTAAIQQQNSLVSTQSSSYKDALDVATSILGTYEQNVAKLAEYDSKLKEIKEQKKAVQDIGVENDQTREIMQQLLADEIKYKQLKSETTSILKTETKLLQAEEGSYDQMSAAVGRLRDALRASNGNLTPEQFTTVSQAVAELDKELKDADKGMGNFFRNVGNYPSAAEGFNKIKVEIAGTTQEFDGAKTAIMTLKNAMAQLAVEGKTDTEEYRGLAEQMRNLQLAMVTVNDEINRSKDASSGLHDTIEMIQGFAAIGTIGQGFAQLFGADDSAITEQIQKMTSLMGILQGLNELKNQMATGTGIGDTLNKLFDVTGLNSSLTQLKTSFSELMVALKSVRTQSEVTAVGFDIMAASAKVASAAVKTLWRALLVGLVIEAVVWIIEELIDGCKALYNAIHDAVSLSDDVERSNNAMADSYATLKTGIEGYLAARDREAASGATTQYQADLDKISALNKALEQNINLSRTSINLAAQNADITPKLGDWTQLSHELENIQRLQAEGREETSAWGDVYKDVLADVIARMNDLDTADSNALQNFVLWTKESPQVQAAITWALNSGDDSMKALAMSIQNGTSSAADLVNMLYQVQAAARAAEIATANLRQELQLREKYGNKWQTEDRVLKSNKEIDQSDLSESEKSQLKALREQDIRATNKAHAAGGRQRVASARSTNNDIINLERQLQQDKLAIMRDGLTKTLATIEDERRRRIETANKMKVDAAKKGEAIAAINARYDKEALEARKKYHEDYLKAEEDFLEKLTKIEYDIAKINNETAMMQSGATFESGKLENDRKTFENLFKRVGYSKRDGSGETVLEFYKVYSEQYTKVMSTYDEILDKMTELDMKRRKIEAEMELPETSGEKKGELKKSLSKIKSDLTELEKEKKKSEDALTELENDRYMVQSAIHSMEKKGEQLSMDSANARFNIWVDHFANLNKLQKEEYKRQYKLQKDANELQTDEEMHSLEVQSKADKKELEKRYDAWAEDVKQRYDVEYESMDEIIKMEKEKYMEMYNNSDNYTNDELQKQYDFYVDLLTKKEQFELDRYNLDKDYKEKMSELNAQNMVRNTELENQYNENIRKLNAETYSQLVNEFNKYASDIENRQSKLKQSNTDDWGFFNIDKFEKDKDKILNEYKILVTRLSLEMDNLRSELSLGLIDPLDFTQSYGELDNLITKIKESIKELSSDNGMEEFMKGIDEWIQQIGQAANQILSAVFDYRNSEFERMKEQLEKQIELVQEKYDQMEELAQKHKDNMNEIEDELTTARGDRRQHLIDALNSEIQAQRDALAEQKKAEKEKQRLEKEGDRIELQRKKEQKKQSLITAVINAALAISQAAANKWPVPAIPLMALAAATGAAQVAAISAQKYAKGGLLQGPTHERGGIKVGGGIEVEGGEFVTNRRTTSQNLDLLYYINSSKKRLDINDFVEFYSNGAKSKPLLGVKGKFEDGGLTPSLEIASRVAEVVVARDDRNIVVSVVDIIDAENDLRRVQAMAGLGQ